MSHSYGAFEDAATGVRPLGMGGAFVAVSDDAHAIFWNPAGLADIDRAHVIANYVKPFGLDILQYGNVSFARNFRLAGIGLSYRVFGSKASIYQEHTGLVSLGKKVTEKISAGMSLRYMALYLGELYGSDWALGVDGGIKYSFSKLLHYGLFIKNSNRPRIATAKEALPIIISTGVALHPFNNLVIAVDGYKDLRHGVQIRMGQELGMYNNFIIRSGIQTNPGRFTIGVGFIARMVSIDYGFLSHSTLGGTHQFSVTSYFNTKMHKVTESRKP